MREASSEYAALVERDAELDAATRGHPAWDALRAVFAEVVWSSEYSQAEAALRARLEGLAETAQGRGAPPTP